MKKMIFLGLVVVTAGYYYYYFNSGKPTPSPVETTAGQAVPVETKTASVSSETPAKAGSIKEFTVVGSEMKFDVSEIKVKVGDTVKINFQNGGNYPHDWVVDEFAAKTKEIKSGETAEITFVADRAGTFEYYCSVMQHRKLGMVGKLIVE